MLDAVARLLRLRCACAQVAELQKEARRLGREAAERRDALAAAAAAEARAAELRGELASARQGVAINAKSTHHPPLLPQL